MYEVQDPDAPFAIPRKLDSGLQWFKAGDRGVGDVRTGHTFSKGRSREVIKCGGELVNLITIDDAFNYCHIIAINDAFNSCAKGLVGFRVFDDTISFVVPAKVFGEVLRGEHLAARGCKFLSCNFVQTIMRTILPMNVT